MTPLAVLSLVNVTGRPPVGAALEIVTVPVELVPPMTDVGLRVRPVKVGAVTVKVTVVLVPFSVAVTEAGMVYATGKVDTVKEADVCPAGIVTEL